MANTSARSPPTTLAQSPTKFVVVTTWTGGPEVVAASTTATPLDGWAEAEPAPGETTLAAWAGWACCAVCASCTGGACWAGWACWAG